MAKAQKKVKKRKVKVESEGLAYIQASFNNLIISLTNRQGEVISWASAGKAGFRGSKKNTPYAAQVAATDAGKVAYDAGLETLRCMSRDLEREENPLSEPSMERVLRLPGFLT